MLLPAEHVWPAFQSYVAIRNRSLTLDMGDAEHLVYLQVIIAYHETG